MIDQIKEELGHHMARIQPENGATFTVRGWPMAIIRNGTGWDILSHQGAEQALEPEQVIDRIKEIIEDLTIESEAGWTDPEPIDWNTK